MQWFCQAVTFSDRADMRTERILKNAQVAKYKPLVWCVVGKKAIRQANQAQNTILFFDGDASAEERGTKHRKQAPGGKGGVVVFSFVLVVTR